MISVRRFALLLTLAALVVALVATPAEAAKRKVPFGFFGAVIPPELTNPGPVSDPALEAQTALMARSGVESVRAFLPWSALQPGPTTYDWARSDRLIGAAARHGLSVTANVMVTPDWASSQPSSQYPERYAPANLGTFAEFMRQMVLRYGPNGSFWAANPSIPKVPVRQWQLYNEQMAPWMWASKPWPKTYTQLLKAAYPVIHQADRGAKVVAGSLVAVGSYTQWAGMAALYKAGAKKYFDVVAIHPFTNNPTSVKDTVERVVQIIKNVRARMKANHDSRKQVILTELTWPAAVGKVPKSRLLGLETTAKGQKVRLKAIYKRLVSDRRKLRLSQAYWFTWATAYDDDSPQSDVSFRFAGLTKLRSGVFSPMPILSTYTSMARKYQGCRKSSDARRCR
jgi:polysaccharide biosynthesis protein PslG